MTEPTIRGHTDSGRPITDQDVESLAAEAETGYDVETLLKRYPALGPAKVLDALAFAYDNTELIEADLSREEALLGPKAEAVPGAMNQEKLPFRK